MRIQVSVKQIPIEGRDTRLQGEGESSGGRVCLSGQCILDAKKKNSNDDNNKKKSVALRYDVPVTCPN